MHIEGDVSKGDYYKFTLVSPLCYLNFLRFSDMPNSRCLEGKEYKISLLKSEAFLTYLNRKICNEIRTKNNFSPSHGAYIRLEFRKRFPLMKCNISFDLFRAFDYIDSIVKFEFFFIHTCAGFLNACTPGSELPSHIITLIMLIYVM